jgi:hypothetical protein
MERTGLCDNVARVQVKFGTCCEGLLVDRQGRFATCQFNP